MGSAAYKQWTAQLDQYAQELKTLTSNGTVVLFRPFIELNASGGCTPGLNWYAGQDTAQFVTLWKRTHDYIMGSGVTNVLWIYNVNGGDGNYLGDGNGNGGYYPGDNYVDIVGFDVYSKYEDYLYWANNGNMYSDLASTGKPVILAELGLQNSNSQVVNVDESQLVDGTRILQGLPNVVGFVEWCGGYDLYKQLNTSTLLYNPLIINRSQMPSF